MSSFRKLEGFCRFANRYWVSPRPSIVSRSISSCNALLGNKVQFNLSDIGEGIRDVVVKEWFVKEGDTVSQFDSLCEVQSDKASVTITSRYDGLITKLHHDVDATALVGEPLVEIEIYDSDDSSSDSDEAADRPVVKSETPKLHAPSHSQPPSHSEPSSPHQQQPTSAIGKQAADDAAAAIRTETNSKALATPAVRRLARELSIDLSQVPGTGKGGRIMKEDVLAWQSAPSSTPDTPPIFQPPVSAQSPSPPVAALPVVFPARRAGAVPEDRLMPLRGIRKAMAKTMTASLAVPHFGLCDDMDASELVRVRGALASRALSEIHAKLTYLPFLIKAASLALLKHPEINAHADPQCENLLIKGSHDIGVAIDSPSGLVVPIVRECQNLSVLDITAQLAHFQDLASREKLTMEHLQGGTFALSNIGAICGTYASPVLVPPQICIGAVGKLHKVPRYREGSDVIEPVHVLPVSWSGDHRFVDGASLARFSKTFKSYVEDPTAMLLSTS